MWAGRHDSKLMQMLLWICWSKMTIQYVNVVFTPCFLCCQVGKKINWCRCIYFVALMSKHSLDTNKIIESLIDFLTFDTDSDCWWWLTCTCDELMIVEVLWCNEQNTVKLNFFALLVHGKTQQLNYKTVIDLRMDMYIHLHSHFVVVVTH